MRLSELGPADLEDRLKGQGLSLCLPPFTVRIQSPFAELARDLERMYADFHLAGLDGFVDFHVQVARCGALRRWLRPQAIFTFDTTRPFAPLPYEQAFPALEWGLNWCVAAHVTDYLILHAAALARDGHALLMPAAPGAGKSTLAAALEQRGWRLLSDEQALIRRSDGLVLGQSRPVSLKNASIGLIRTRAPEAVFSTEVRDTVKGTVCHLRPAVDSVERVAEAARVRWVVLPRYRSQGAAAQVEPLGRGRALLACAEASFNYPVLGSEGFDLLADMVADCDCRRLYFHDLEAAVRVLDALEAQP